MADKIIETNMANLKYLLSLRKKKGKGINKSSEQWVHYRKRVYYRLIKVVLEAERFQSRSYQEMFEQFLDLLVSTQQLQIQGKRIYE